MSGEIQTGTRVRAAATSLYASQAAAGTDWESVVWSYGAGDKTTTSILAAPNVLAHIRGYADVADCQMRIMSRPAVGYPWVELVVATTVSVAVPVDLDGRSGNEVTDSEVSDQVLLDAQLPSARELLVQTKQITAGGTINLGLLLK